MVQLVEVDRLTTDQAAFMDTLAVRALEQLWQNNHPGWDVPGAGLSSLVAVKHLFQVQPGSCICLMRGEYERMLQQEESAVLPDLRLALPFRGVPSAEHALPAAYGAAPQLPSGPLQTQWLAAPSPSGVLPGVEPLVFQEASAASQTASSRKRSKLFSVKVVSQAVTGEDPPSAQQAHTESAAASSQNLRQPVVLRPSASAQCQSGAGPAASASSQLLLPCPAKSSDLKSSSESADRKSGKRHHSSTSLPSSMKDCEHWS